MSLFLDILLKVPVKSEVDMFTRGVLFYLKLKTKLWAGDNSLGNCPSCV